LHHYLVVGAILFILGMIGFLSRRNLIVMFLCAEMMLQGVALNLVAFARYGGNLTGQAFVLFVLTVAACEAAIARLGSTDMHMKTISVAAAVFCLATAGVMAQEPITKTKSVSGTATIQAIDATTRAITLRDETGVEDTYIAGPEVKRFEELKVGDTIKMTYSESVVVQVRKAGAAPTGTTGAAPADPSVDAAVTRGTGALPGVTAAVQAKMTATVKAIDAATPSVTVTTSDGRTVTRKVEDKKNLEGVAVGDQIDITYTRALLTAVERAAK
jgi:NADH:ubiquinone oxidoreductase subunit K/Cu/Ag efflux protein CusF